MRQGILGEAASAHQPLPPHQLNQLRTSFLSTVASPARHENARQEKQDRSRTHATHATPRNATPRHATHATHATQAMPRFDAHHTGSLITSCMMGHLNETGIGIAACDTQPHREARGQGPPAQRHGDAPIGCVLGVGLVLIGPGAVFCRSASP